MGEVFCLGELKNASHSGVVFIKLLMIVMKGGIGGLKI
jgi:hypothetical protein